MLESRCPEGSAETIGVNVIAVSFVHMTPGVPCEIDVASDSAPPQLTRFTARGMPDAEVVEGWGRTYGGLNLVVFAMIAGQVAIAAFLVRARLRALATRTGPRGSHGTGRAGMRTPLPNTYGGSTASRSAIRGPASSRRLPAAAATRPSGSRPPCPCHCRASGRCCRACATTALSTAPAAWIPRLGSASRGSWAGRSGRGERPCLPAARPAACLAARAAPPPPPERGSACSPSCRKPRCPIHNLAPSGPDPRGGRMRTGGLYYEAAALRAPWARMRTMLA